MEEDPFDSVQNLEEQYHNEGYALGLADGAKAGHLEGRFFGLEKGFEKFVEMGKLRGRSTVMSSRLTPAPTDSLKSDVSRTHDASPSFLRERNKHSGCAAEILDKKDDNIAVTTTALPQLPQSLRLEKHIQTFHALSEPESLDTQNSEHAVSDFDERLKRAKIKAKIIEKSIGEELASMKNLPYIPSIDDASIEDTSILNTRY